MTQDLQWMTSRPIAHRGLHDAQQGRIENTLSACEAAIENGFNIEVDLHPASDNEPVIFHDLTLERLNNDPRQIRSMTALQLGKIKIAGGNDHIASLDELLELTNGKVGLVLELKGLAGEDTGFVRSLLKTLENYQGPVAIMSFYHWLLEDANAQAPHLPLGLTALGGEENYTMHKSIADKVEFDFLSYKWKHLPCKFSEEFSQTNKPVICWTVKSYSHLERAAPLCDQITFEGFNPDELDMASNSAKLSAS